MGQISGVNASSITSIAGVSVANISYVGPTSAATLGLGGVLPVNLPFNYTPGLPPLGSTLSYATDVAAPSSHMFIGAVRGVDDEIYTAPTFQLSNLNSKFYNYNYGTTDNIIISQWVRINDFPYHHASNGTLGIRLKRSSLSKYHFPSGNGLDQGYIEFGAMAPYYLDAGGAPIYKFQMSPISLGVVIAGKGDQGASNAPVSIYTDYQYNLNQWYMVTVHLQSTDFTDYTSTKNIKFYVNNTLVECAFYKGIPWKTRTYAGYHNKSRRNQNSPYYVNTSDSGIATQPGFLRHDGNTQPSAPQYNYVFKHRFPNIAEMNHASFSPVVVYAGNTTFSNPNGTKNRARQNSRVDFGELNIYTGTSDNISTLYSNTSRFY